MRYSYLLLFLAFPGWIMAQQKYGGKYQDYILTPEPPISPLINGPELYAIWPGSPFIYGIRDLWRHHDLGKYSGQFTTLVQPHEVTLIRLFTD